MRLEPKFTITNAILSALTQIENARGFLNAAVLSESWIRSLQDKALILEAHHTTHIEGTQLTLAQSEKVLQGETFKNANPNDVREIINYRDAFDLVSDYLNCKAPITEGLIREIHKRLVNGVRGNSATPGEYRKIQNYVINSNTNKVIYTPPPAFEVAHQMQTLVHYLNQTKETHPVLLSGVAQFQFVHIHPFLDGNGRTARLLSTLCLYCHGYDFKKLFTMSEYYDRNRTHYYQAIQSVRENNMDMTNWLEYFTKGLAEQMQGIQIKGENAIQTNILAKQHQLSDRQAEALQYILQQGELTIQNFENAHPDTPRRSLQRDLKELIDKKLVISKGATNKLTYKLAPKLA